MSFFVNFFRNFIHSMLQLFSLGKNSMSSSLSVNVKTNTGNTLAVELNPKWDIKIVKDFVASQLGLEPEDLKIIFAGKELSDSTVLEECDLGQQSVLHAIKVSAVSKTKNKRTKFMHNSDIIEEGSKPFSETLLDLQLTQGERSNILESDKKKLKAHFYVTCSDCQRLTEGKLRVRCARCKSGAFTVHSDPHSWDDVLKHNRITGECMSEHNCSVILQNDSPTFAEFYFKCSEHESRGECDQAVPLYLIKPNIKEIPCLSCTDVDETVLVFPCNAGHVTCIDCFRHYCTSRLRDRQFWCHPEFGYTLPCPVGCENSFIEEIHHFKLMTSEQYEQYQRFAAEEFVLQAGGVLCPQPGCGMGILSDEGCTKIACVNGCGYVFCRNCLQGYHLGDCATTADPIEGGSCEYRLDPEKVNDARWDVASRITILVTSKPCPKCRTPTERSGGCMHMVCTRAGCGFEWCWVCQTTWSRDCMAAHWFG